MKHTMQAIINELASRKVEWSPKQRVQINLFEEEFEPGIRINTFGSINQYRLYLAKIYDEAKSLIEIEISQLAAGVNIMVFLEDYLILLKENQITYLPDNFDFILFSVEFKSAPQFKDAASDAIKKNFNILWKRKKNSFLNLIYLYEPK